MTQELKVIGRWSKKKPKGKQEADKADAYKTCQEIHRLMRSCLNKWKT
jgi:hypothetical protein